MDLYAEILWHQSSAPFSSCHQESLHCHRACAAQAVVHTKKSSLLAQHRRDCCRNTPKSQVYSHSIAKTATATRQKVESTRTASPRLLPQHAKKSSTYILAQHKRSASASAISINDQHQHQRSASASTISINDQHQHQRSASASASTISISIIDQH